MMDMLALIGGSHELFLDDLNAHQQLIGSAVEGVRALVIGGAGSIGRAVVKELFPRQPRVLHVVDVSENNLTELVRDVRSSLGYAKGEFRLFCLDCGSLEFDALLASQPPYDYILNLSALKHVRSERDPFTLMRMIKVNILCGERLLRYASEVSASKFFAVSTDKAANPVNMMGATKRLMELLMMRASTDVRVSSARFANVAFSDGSLPDAFTYRVRKRQPLSAPRDVQRYFITDKEAAALCMMAAFVGHNRETLFPKLSRELRLMTFADIACNYLESIGYSPFLCQTEDEARAKVDELCRKRMWPCYFFDSDTTGEKELEEFYSDDEEVILDRFKDIGVIVDPGSGDYAKLDDFLKSIEKLRSSGKWSKTDLVALFNATLSNFSHRETFKYLDDRM
jgi:FlaA1/EpsC-like NDP-sugar epimerase